MTNTKNTAKRYTPVTETFEPKYLPRTFYLYRHEDVSGTSGAGVIAYGSMFADGTSVVHWAGDRPSTVVWDSVEDADAIHGHGGATEIIWSTEDVHYWKNVARSYCRGVDEWQRRYEELESRVGNLQASEAELVSKLLRERLDNIRSLCDSWKKLDGDDFLRGTAFAAQAVLARDEDTVKGVTGYAKF